MYISRVLLRTVYYFTVLCNSINNNSNSSSQNFLYPGLSFLILVLQLIIKKIQLLKI